MCANINLSEWNPDFPIYKTNDKDRPIKIKPKSIKPFSMIICSTRNQGKSTIIKYLYKTYFKNKYDIVIVFSKTLNNGFYSFVKSSTKYSKFDPNIIHKLLEIQNNQSEKTGYYYNILLIFDDMLGNDIFYSQEVSDIFTNGRHHAISIIFATQNPTCCNQSWRQNTTHLIVLRCKGRGQDHIINGFLLDIIDEEKDTSGMRADRFLRILMKKIFEERYRAIVIEYDKDDMYINQCMFYFKVPLHSIKK